MTDQPLLAQFFDAAVKQGHDPALVLLKDKKPCQKNWRELRPTVKQVLEHLERNPSRNAMGIQPASLGCVVLDCDEGDGPDTAAEILTDRYGDVVACVTPSTSGRADRGHVWVRCIDAEAVGNWKFKMADAIDEVEGDMRTTGGQVRLNDEAMSRLSKMLRAADGLEDEAATDVFSDLRTSTAREVDLDFDRELGNEVSEEVLALLADRLDGPDGGPRHEHFFAIAADLKSSGASFDAALDLLSYHVPLWADENGEDDGKYEGTELERHLALAWSKLPPQITAAEDFEDDLEIEGQQDAEGAGVNKAGNPIDLIVEEMNEVFCGVLHGNQFQVFMEDTDDAFPDRKTWTSLNRDAFRNYFQDEKVPLPDTPKNRFPSKADLWLEHPKRRKYRGIVMDPQNLARNRGKLNLWRGWAIEPRPGDWSLMEELIGDVLCDRDAASEEYVRRWIAYMLQKPWETPEAAIAFRGSEGTGKGTLGRALMRISGTHGLTVSSRAQFAGRFNAHLRNCVFLFADEAVWPGDKDGEGIIKQLVTEPIISYEAKGKDITPGRNMVHMMLASNEDWIVPAGKDARRFFVSDVSDRRRNDQAFFGRLWQQMEDGGFAAMMHDLMAMDLDGWRPASTIPQTRALGDQKIQSLDPASKFWLSVLSEGTLAHIIFNEGEIDDWSATPIEIGSDEKDQLVAAYDSYLKRNRILSVRPTHKALVKAAKPFGLETKRLSAKERGWVIPRLPDMRAKFERTIGAEGVFDA
ncbi:MAG: DUF5906 domain-containing protein [Pseudomonadota bacterium]